MDKEKAKKLYEKANFLENTWHARNLNSLDVWEIWTEQYQLSDGEYLEVDSEFSLDECEDAKKDNPYNPGENLPWDWEHVTEVRYFSDSIDEKWTTENV